MFSFKNSLTCSNRGSYDYLYQYVCSISLITFVLFQDIETGFKVDLLTTSGTIANTGPPPTCSMRICNSNGDDISSAEVGDTLMLKVNYTYSQGSMRICNSNGDDISSAEVGDTLMLKVNYTYSQGSMRICNSNGDDISSAEVGDTLMLKVSIFFYIATHKVIALST